MWDLRTYLSVGIDPEYSMVWAFSSSINRNQSFFFSGIVQFWYYYFFIWEDIPIIEF